MAQIKVNWISDDKDVANVTVLGDRTLDDYGMSLEGNKVGLIEVGEAFKKARKVGDTFENPNVKHDRVRVVPSKVVDKETGEELTFNWLVQ